jgi:hypothetical protein
MLSLSSILSENITLIAISGYMRNNISSYLLAVSRDLPPMYSFEKFTMLEFSHSSMQLFYLI